MEIGIAKKIDYDRIDYRYGNGVFSELKSLYRAYHGHGSEKSDDYYILFGGKLGPHERSEHLKHNAQALRTIYSVAPHYIYKELDRNLAGMLGCSVSVVRNWRYGLSEMSAAAMYAIEKAFGMEGEFFLFTSYQKLLLEHLIALTKNIPELLSHTKG